jgi:hypothetical protein
MGGVKQAPKSRKDQKSEKTPASSGGGRAGGRAGGSGGRGRAGGSGGGAPPAFTKQRSRHYAQSIYKGVCGKSKTMWTWRCKILPPLFCALRNLQLASTTLSLFATQCFSRP